VPHVPHRPSATMASRMSLPSPWSNTMAETLSALYLLRLYLIIEGLPSCCPFPTPEDEDALGRYHVDGQEHPPPPVMAVIKHVAEAEVKQDRHGIHVHDLRARAERVVGATPSCPVIPGAEGVVEVAGGAVELASEGLTTGHDPFSTIVCHNLWRISRTVGQR
jgi:hypothetical protein